MPTDRGQRGKPGVLAVPALGRPTNVGATGGGRPTGGGPMQGGVGKSSSPCGLRRARPFRSPALNAVGRFIVGVTRDSAGTALASCTVELFDARTGALVDRVTSDGSGAFTFGASGGPYYIVAYKPGSPDVFGTTVATLTGAPL